ncbi:Lrp/AsnC family transcriptional regulator [Deinococcus peraridilitoris]|uniref:siroheme decarboxylase n=1 Tax=Deinococcus peraridilitoris (strain DSM 19664 / LMG 22246 / CIP 109416 / KR-200) TaxID=937777 RepID=L0A1M6_DEIPD|nr:Lrp/AsnC family transcriptional regulator [Deinococcus peraridilitoris]AFZ66915.1 transcriptional regulator [Deinococcus peraridilitoris DSM 19664]
MTAVTETTPRELLLNRVQKDIPIVARPYRVLAQEVGLTEEAALAILREEKDKGVLRQISAIFDTRTLGYQSSLVAVKADPDKLDAVAEVINAHPGVSHNYKRNHDFNLWYTIAVPPESDLEAHVQKLHEVSGADLTRLMPTLHLYKIGVEFDMTGTEDWNAKSKPQYTNENRNIGYQVSGIDRQFVLEFQKDLPLVEEPYASACAALGMTIEELSAHAAQMKAAGALRRVSAVFRHQKAGFTFNAMGVWAVPQSDVARVGQRMAEFKAVSHCYLRPTYPEWPYTIFTMVHGRSKEEAFGKIQAIADEVAQGIDHAILYSTKEYKKVRLEFYKPEFYEWAREHLGTEA